MRWPIRNQILLPFAALQVVAVAVLSVLSAWFTVGRVEEETARRLGHVIGTLGASRFPLTNNVLEQMRGLSEADFVVINHRQQVEAATLSIPPDSARSLTDLNVPLDTVTLDDSSRVLLDARRFFAARVNVRGAEGPATLWALYPEDRWRTARREAVLVPLIIGGLTMAGLVGMSIWLAGRLGRRMRSIQDQVARIAGGEFQPIPLERRDDEIRDLSVSINQMSEALRSMTAAIRLAEREALMTQLASGLAHQLRNAITGARMAIQLHVRRCNGTDDESLEVALRQLSFTEEQLKGLLRVARDEGRTPVPGELADVVRDVVALVTPQCDHERVRLEVEASGVELPLADTDALRTALLNLALNAIEAAGPQGYVALRVREGDPPRVEVSDDGPGVAPEVAANLFEPFVTTKPEGVGLGLMLAWRIARDLGGGLTHHREGHRTVFTLSLPHGARAGLGQISRRAGDMSLPMALPTSSRDFRSHVEEPL